MNKMYYTWMITLVLASLLVTSCSSKVEYCNYNGKEVPCDYYKLYQHYSGMEREINETFEEGKSLSTSASLAQRERFVRYADSRADSLVKAFDLLGIPRGHHEQLMDMRREEITHFKERLNKENEIAKMLANMDFRQRVDTDTSKWSAGDKVIIASIVNTGDRPISSIFARYEFLNDSGKVIYAEETNVLPYGPNMEPKVSDTIMYIPPGHKFNFSHSFPSRGNATKGILDGRLRILNLAFSDEETDTLNP